MFIGFQEMSFRSAVRVNVSLKVKYRARAFCCGQPSGDKDLE